MVFSGEILDTLAFDRRNNALVLPCIENAEVGRVHQKVPQSVDRLFLFFYGLLVSKPDHLRSCEKQQNIVILVVKEELAASVVVKFELHLLIFQKLAFTVNFVDYDFRDVDCVFDKLFPQNQSDFLLIFTCLNIKDLNILFT